MKTHLIFVAFLGAALALVGPLAKEGRANFTLWNDEQLTVNTAHDWGWLYDQSLARIVAGGSVNMYLYAHDTSTVNLSGGYVENFSALDSSAVDISGGGVVWQFGASTSSTVAIAGGTVVMFNATDSTAVNISGGSVNVYLRAWDTTSVDISGGYVESLSAFGSSTVDISDGSVRYLSACNTSTVTFLACDFHLGDGLSLGGKRVLGTGILSGEWFDGTPWEVNIAANEPGATIWTPEPASLALLAVGGLVVLRRRRRASRFHHG